MTLSHTQAMTEWALLGGRNGPSLLNDRPMNAETRPHLVDDAITPAARIFIRNTGLVPDHALAKEASGWQITMDGEVGTSLTLPIADLKVRFQG